MFLFLTTSITLGRVAMMQATPSYPTLTQPTTSTQRDTSQISTSFASSKSGSKNEILTETIDYGGPSPDTHSILVDTVDQSGNRGLHLPMEDTFDRARGLDLTPANRGTMENDPSARRTNHRRWSLNNCLQCMSAVNNETDTRPYMREAPPTYSTIYTSRATTTQNWSPFQSTNQSSFVTPIPPPSYAQAQGIRLSPYSMDHLFSIPPNANGFWPSRPMTTICPRCTMIIVTTIEVRQSVMSHVTAVALFLCGCWPCCMIPYCMNSCKTIDHYCPICRAYLGTYRPW